MHLSVSPPPPERTTLAPWASQQLLILQYSRNLSFSRYLFLQGEGEGQWALNIEIATESVNRSLFRRRKGLHWLLSWFLFSGCKSTGAVEFGKTGFHSVIWRGLLMRFWGICQRVANSRWPEGSVYTPELLPEGIWRKKNILKHLLESCFSNMSGQHFCSTREGVHKSHKANENFEKLSKVSSYYITPTYYPMHS